MDEFLWIHLQSQLAAYLTGTLSLSHLEAWMLANDPALLESSADDLIDAAGLLSLGIADLHHGHISEDDLKNEIRRYLAGTTLIVSLGNPQMRTGSSNRTISR
jgi:hypothetical protein